MRWWFVLSTLFIAFQAHAEIYKCKNENGTIVYQATICTAGAVGTIKKAPDIPIEEQMRAQERVSNIVEANRQKEATRELERQQRNEAKMKYDLDKKAVELERRKEAQEKYKEQLLRRQTEAAERAAAAAERNGNGTLHCKPDYAGGMYCN
ncbi:MAG: DUF4124 domain-containing protein [Methylotenera sp.]